MKILVVTPCTAAKKHEPANQLQRADFATPGLLRLRSRRLEEFETPAAQMYIGNGHLRLMNGVKDLRRSFGQDIADVRIISPGYGLLNEDDPIVPYEYTFDGQSQVEIRQRSRRLGIHEEIERLLPSYDLAFFLLSKDYVTACNPPFVIQNPAEQIFLVSESDQAIIPRNRPHIHAVCAGNRLIAQLDGANKFNLKGVVFERLCKVACNRGRNHTGNGCPCDSGLEVFEEVKRNPQRMIDMVLDCNREL